VLTGCRPDMPAFREETFGPLAAVMRVASAGEAISAANDSDFGLGGNIWTRDEERGVALARQIAHHFLQCLGELLLQAGRLRCGTGLALLGASAGILRRNDRLSPGRFRFLAGHNGRTVARDVADELVAQVRVDEGLVATFADPTGRHLGKGPRKRRRIRYGLAAVKTANPLQGAVHLQTLAQGFGGGQVQNDLGNKGAR